MVSPGEAVLELVELHRQEASVLERRHDIARARLLRDVATEYESVIKQTRPEWVSADVVQARTGWSRRWLWARAQQLAHEDPPQARKRGGRWQFAREAADDVPTKPSHREGEIHLEGRDGRDLAAQLGRER